MLRVTEPRPARSAGIDVCPVVGRDWNNWLARVGAAWFAAEFDRPFSSYGSWDGERVLPGVSPAKGGRQTGGYVTFDNSSVNTVRIASC